MNEVEREAGRRELARALKALRLAKSLSGQALADALEWPQPKVSKIETGRQKPTLEDIKVWTALTGAGANEAERLRSLAIEIESFSQPWASATSPADRQREIAELEAQAVSIRNYQGYAVPGLLQTSEYAERVLRMVYEPVGKGAGVPAAVAARMDRQAVLFNSDKRFTFVLAESALKWQPHLMQVREAQVQRLLAMESRPNITLAVIPFGDPWPLFIAPSFTIFDIPDQPEILIEDGDGERRASADPDTYEARFKLAMSVAIRGRRAREFIRRSAQ